VKGMTLIELMISVLILALIIIVVGHSYQLQVKRANFDAALLTFTILPVRDRNQAVPDNLPEPYRIEADESSGELKLLSKDMKCLYLTKRAGRAVMGVAIKGMKVPAALCRP